MQKKLADTHVHIWNFEKATYNWLKNDTSILNRNYLVEEYDRNRQEIGITEAILVQAANNFEDTDNMLQAAEDNDWITGVVGWLPLMDADATMMAIENRYGANKYFKGVRHLIHDEADPEWLLQPAVIESLKILAKHNLTYDLVGVLTTHITTAMEVAHRVPELKMVFNHINQPPVSTKEKFGIWGDLMDAASRHPNFYVKISGLGVTSKNPDWTAEDIFPYVNFALEKFGTDRCFCGGNWPVSLLAGSFKKTWQNYIDVIETLLNISDQEKVFYQNAQTFYSL